MTPEQRRAVAKRTDPRLSEPQQWYNLFMTLFPRELLPKTPYLGTELQEITNTVRQYWRENRRSIITSVMRSHQNPKITSPEGEDPPEHVAGSVEEIHRLSAEVFADAMDILLRSLLRRRSCSWDWNTNFESTDDSQKPLDNQLGISDVTVNEVGPGLAEPEADPELYLYSAGLTFLTDTDLEGIAGLDQ
ncbi:hypothetical protein CMUS01_15719 [Colletotrichum musicola]|uniref:Uncharacterized protein n=1 Tax=Colletotrichum musicola TaxID=2175873 RepID=A0A8H6IUR1_9PEZI|nr:hypothetical protein CMUS01_15719 [Colletotrichum musicola]